MKALTSLAAIKITGADSKSFLQGQLSNDLNLLSPNQPLLASCNSVQGRVQAVVTLIELDDGIVAILPTTMIDLFITRLRKYILRSKVIIADARATLQCYVATREELNDARLPAPASSGEHVQHQEISVMHWWDRQAERYLILQAHAAPESTADADAADEQWLLADIRAGLPQVLPTTHEVFVAQMLNLDALNGISFNKGCYTGQEIIARAHFRGAVKRRMYRLHAACPPPPPATRIVSAADGTHAGDVVLAATVESGCDLLAVLNLSQVSTPLGLEADSSLPLTILPLPYDVPTLTTQ